MLKFLGKRIGMALFGILGVTMFIFVISHMLPADPVATALGPQATQEQIDALRHDWGLDLPIYVQFGRYLKGLAKGDLGESIVSRRKVSEELMYFFPGTLELTVAGMAISLVLGIFLGVISAVKRNQWIDHIIRGYTIMGISIPIFWLALLLLLVFYLWLGWFPGGGRIAEDIHLTRITGLMVVDAVLTLNFKALGSSLWHLALPAFCLSCSTLATVCRITRASVLQVIGEEYVQAARAKGVNEFLVLFKHVLRNALLPVVTISGILFGNLLAGAVLTETIFSWPGMGRYVVRSIMYLDFQPIMGFTVLCALIYALSNLIVDILYSVINPQVRLN